MQRFVFAGTTYEASDREISMWRTRLQIRHNSWDLGDIRFLYLGSVRKWTAWRFTVIQESRWPLPINTDGAEAPTLAALRKILTHRWRRQAEPTYLLRRLGLVMKNVCAHMFQRTFSFSHFLTCSQSQGPHIWTDRASKVVILHLELPQTTAWEFRHIE